MGRGVEGRGRWGGEGGEWKEATKKRGVHTVGHTQLEHGGCSDNYLS